ncbi:alpha/beta fold hydrolase [Rhizobium gallicum]|nr:alpha/beta hydrolase [Rhizobium gallicum]
MVLDRECRKIWTDFDGGRMVWRVWGEGHTLILLHGAYGSWLHWIRQVQPLARRFQLVLPDMPGFGESDGIRSDTMDPLVTALSSGLDQIGLPARFGLGAFSFGCRPAARLLHDWHEHIDQLFLFGTSAFGRADQAPRLQRWQELDEIGRVAAHRHNLRTFMLHDPNAATDEVVAIQSYNAVHARYPAYRLYPSVNVEQLLAERPVQLTFAWGSEDVLYRNHLETSRQTIAALYPAARAYKVDGAGHWLQMERPDDVNRIFLQTDLHGGNGYYE